MTPLNDRAITALTTLRNAVRDVARSLLDDAPHTYVSSVSSVLTRAVEQRKRTSLEVARTVVAGELEGLTTILQVLPRDPWVKFTEDAARCAKKLMTEIDPDEIAKEERCVATLVQEAKVLCNLPEVRDVTNALGTFTLVRIDHGRKMEVYLQGASDILFVMAGAVSDAQIERALRVYYTGLHKGIAQGSEEIRAGLRLLIGVAAA